MPIDITYMDDGKGVLLAGRGVVSGRDIIDATEEIFSTEEKTKAYKYGLNDFCDIEDFDVATEEVKHIAKLDERAARLNPDIAVALVADQDIAFGLSRMWEVFAEATNWKTSVYRSLDEAKEWVRDEIKNDYDIDLHFT